MGRFGLRTQTEGLGPFPSPCRRRAASAGAIANRLLPALFFAATLSACTIVNVRDAAGVRTSYYPGVAVIRVTPRDSAQVVEVESVGVAAVGNSATLGWSHSRIALVPPGRCHLILWRPRATDLEQLRTLTGPSTEICDVKGEVK